jgi:hypothetical protein
VAACYAMHLLHSIAIQPNLELNTQPKQFLGSLQLDITLPDHSLKLWPCSQLLNHLGQIN